jgi:hypothetical protein
MKKIIPLLALIIALSCSEDPLVSQKKENILSFKNSEEILAYVKGPKEDDGNFQSFEDLFIKANEELAAAQTEEEHSRIMDAYSDILKIEDETYKPIIMNSVYRSIINRERLYISGDYVHKVLDDDYIIYTKKENINALRHLNTTDNLDKKIFTVTTYQGITSDLSNGKTNANCGPTHQKDYFHNESNCRNDRRVWVRGHTYYIINGNQYSPAVIAEAWGELRRGTWCNWARYHTILSVQNCSFTVHIEINGGEDDLPYTNVDLPDYTSTTDIYGYTIVNQPLYANGGYITWAGGFPPTIEFSAIHLEANSRGVGFGNWAIIDCPL